jgi:hypothetical protein
LLGWPKAKALEKANAEEIAKFFWKDIICRHGIFKRFIINSGFENYRIVKAFAKKYSIKRV